MQCSSFGIVSSLMINIPTTMLPPQDLHLSSKILVTSSRQMEMSMMLCALHRGQMIAGSFGSLI
jgi:hypothetical protein